MAAVSAYAQNPSQDATPKSPQSAAPWATQDAPWTMSAQATPGGLKPATAGDYQTKLAAYVLASFQQRDVRSAEAGLKYFVLGALASGMLLYGISLLYGFTGSTTFADIRCASRPDTTHTTSRRLTRFVPVGTLRTRREKHSCRRNR